MTGTPAGRGHTTLLMCRPVDNREVFIDLEAPVHGLLQWSIIHLLQPEEMLLAF